MSEAVAVNDRRVRAGPSAWRDAVVGARYERWLVAASARIVKDRHLAEDICQDVLLAFWFKPEAFDPSRGTILAYLTTLCRSRSQDVVRAEEARRRREERSHHLFGASRGADPADNIADEDLWEAMATLNPSEAQAIVLAFREDLSYTEVAAHLDIPVGTAKSRIRRGLVKLRSTLDDPVPSEPASLTMPGSGVDW